MTRKMDCWEYMSCGKGPGDHEEGKHDTCPVTTETRLHGVHDGRNAGRACWVVMGTKCHGDVAGAFAAKYKDCQACPFYASVKKDEGGRFKLSSTLLKKLSPEE